MRVMNFLDEIEFTGNDSKKAYLKASKWIAQNIISQNIKNVVWNIEKISEDPVIFKVTLYVQTDLDEISKRKCEACKDFHTKFYINQQFNCDKCNMQALLATTREKLKIMSQYVKERINT